MTVHRVAHHLSEGEILKDQPIEGRSRVVKTKTIRKVFERNPKLKMTHLAEKNSILVSMVKRAVKIEGGKMFEVYKKALIDCCDETEATL